ncbi:hypothetical protein KKA24_02150 [Patescibacteria group bacterium]|nr:hypothetical protein [Patescibacteria group bacterium]
MWISIIFLTVLVIILTIAFILLTIERLKDFRILRLYSMANQALITYFELPETDKPGMVNIALESKDKKPFYGLIGIAFGVPILGDMAFKCYGYIKSDREGKAIFSIHNRKKDQCLFFLSSREVVINEIFLKSR